MTQRMIEITSPWFLREEDLSSPADWAAVFGRHAPLTLEIGCGIGDFITELATRSPERDFLAIDIFNKGCHKTCNRIALQKLANVRVMRIEARYLLARHLSPESLAAVHINCPDPWPKKRHRKRRLVNRTFLQTLLHYLQPGADLYFSSDVTDYAEDVADELAAIGGYENRLAEPVTRNLPGYPLSKYMRRFLAQGQPIHFIHHRRDPRHVCDTTPPQPEQRGFRMAWRCSHG